MLDDVILTRRNMIRRAGMGFGALGLAALMTEEGLLGDSDTSSESPLMPKESHFAPRVKHVIHLFMNGGPSQVDTFDPKPALEKYAGKDLPINLRTEAKTGGALPSPWKFRKYGQSGIPVSDLYPHVAKCVDNIAVIRSLYTDLPNHEPSMMMMNCGDIRLVRPSVGSWLTYGLGTANQNLPGFIAMSPGGYPVKEVENWRSAFLPGAYQGTYVDTQHEEIDKLIQYIRNPHLSLQEQRRQLDLLEVLNRRHLEKVQQESQLEARIQSFELAYNMQMEAADAFDIRHEPQSIRDMYGEGVQARQMIIARRLIERGVRFVQVFHSKGQPWDQHTDLKQNHSKLAAESDQPIAALLKDLQQRGMFDETLVIWGGEFGRTPGVQIADGATVVTPNGRDHNPHGFSMWMAGGGIKGGTIYGATDEFGFQAVENRMHVHDLHATILHLMGLDHERLTFHYAGRDFRLTDVHGRVINELLA